MAGNVTNLPSELESSVARARAARADRPVLTMPRRVLDPTLGAWAQEILDTGELDRALAAVAASDPELA